MPAIAIGLHFQDIRSFSSTAVCHGLFGCLMHGDHIHAIHFIAWNAVSLTTIMQIGTRRGNPLYRGSHAIFIVFNDIDYRQLPKGGHVESLIDLALIHRAITGIGHADIVCFIVFHGKGDTGAKGNLCTDDAMPAIEMLFLGEHVHGTALALGITPFTPRQVCHDALRIHATGQHVTMIPVRGDNRIALFCGGLHAGHDSFLPDIEVTKPTDQTHAIQLPRLFLKTADQKHVLIIIHQVAFAGFCRLGRCRLRSRFASRTFRGRLFRHRLSPRSGLSQRSNLRRAIRSMNTESPTNFFVSRAQPV